MSELLTRWGFHFCFGAQPCGSNLSQSRGILNFVAVPAADAIGVVVVFALMLLLPPLSVKPPTRPVELPANLTLHS